jgi:asparagine synthase (glutamine-hydrolysing)
MCGIAGIVRNGAIGERDLRRVERMGEVMHYRGPDDQGTRQGPGYAFSHRRLSIIDLEGGHQPMSNSEGDIWLVYNGEVYNHDELRHELEEKGHRFRTRCDTEAIIHLYEEEGIDCVKRINGMFAFALFDERQRRLLMARDRAGIKPLYYSFEDGTLAFASEAKALVQTAQRLLAAEERSIVDFFALSLVQEGRTAFKGIRELRPAHVLVWSLDGRPLTERYWSPSYRRKTEMAGAELEEVLSALLEDAVRRHLVSDVPVGTYLSGGLDSSLVSAIAEGYLDSLDTFSAGFSGNETVDERRYAREAAAMIGSTHHEVEVGPEDFFTNLRRIVWHMDEPTLSPGVYPYYFLCGLVSETVKVVLGGQGSDELFGGYNRYRMALLERKMDSAFSRMRLPSLIAGAREYRRRYGSGSLKNALLRLGAGDPRRIYEVVSGFHPRRLPRLFSEGFRKRIAEYEPLDAFMRSLEGCDSDDLIDLMLYNDYHNMLASILRTEDRMSMAHSIESRVPILDYRLVELAASIPPSAKVSGDDPKRILKRVARGRVPQRIIERRKQGFSAPVDSWFAGPLGAEVEEFLLGERACSRGYFDADYVARLFKRFRSGGRDTWRIWSLVTFEMWCRVFIDGEGPGG